MHLTYSVTWNKMFKKDFAAGEVDKVVTGVKEVVWSLVEVAQGYFGEEWKKWIWL